MTHRLSSAYHPHANLRAELGVKTIKRLVRDNLSPTGDLNTDKLGRALMTYRNTPNKDLGLSPAQILYGRVLRDHLPSKGSALTLRKDWLMSRDERERALASSHGRLQSTLMEHTKSLPKLELGDPVIVPKP